MRPEARAVLDQEERDTLGTLLPWIGGGFLLAAVEQAATRAGSLPVILTLAAGALASFAALRAVRSDRLPSRWSHPVAAAVMAIGLAATTLDYPDAPAGIGFTSFLLVILCTAAILVSPPWVMAFSAATLLAWLGSAAAFRDGPIPSTALLIMVLAVVVAGCLTFVRSRSALRHDALRRAASASEERYRALVEGLPVGVYRTSPEGRVLDANGTAARLMGIGTREELLRTPVERLYRDPRRRAEWMARLEREGEVRGEEIEGLRTDGGVRWLRDSARAVRGSDGRTVWYDGVVEDITEQKRAQQDLEETRRQVIASEKLSTLGTLVAGVAHEINNPLTYMRGNSELVLMSLQEALADPALPPRLRASLQEAAGLEEAVLRGADRVAHVAQSLRKVARRPSALRQSESINAIVESVVTVALSRVKDEREVMVDLHARSPVVVDADEISQVLLNLVLNAVDAMEGSPAGRLAIRTFEEGPWVVVEVEDEGRGIPSGEAAKIFTPFHTTKPEGTGLGLSVSLGIVESHGGSLTFRSQEGRGATFRMALPAGGARVTGPALSGA